MSAKKSAAVVAFASIAALASCAESEGVAEMPQAIPTVAYTHIQNDTLPVEAACITRPSAVVTIKSEIAGRVSEVLAQIGDTVQKNQVLASIDARDLQIELDRRALDKKRIESQIKLAEIRVEKSDRDAKIMRDLADRSGTKRKDSFNPQELALRETATELERLRIDLEDLELRRRDLLRSLEKTTIQSPLSGVVTKRNAQPGAVIGSGIQNVGGGDILFEVADVSTLRVECFVREADAAMIQPNAAVRITAAYRGASVVQTTISRVAPSIELVAGVPRLRFEAEFQSAGSGWLPGSNATALVLSNKTAEPRLPPGSVGQYLGEAAVIVKSGSGLVLRQVEVERTDDGWLVRSGLLDGERVVLDFERGLPKAVD